MQLAMLPIIVYVGLVGVIIGIVITRSLPKHVDMERMQSIGNPARAFSSFGPSYEVLSDRGRQLLAISYVFYSAGFMLPMIAALITFFAR